MGMLVRFNIDSFRSRRCLGTITASFSFVFSRKSMSSKSEFVRALLNAPKSPVASSDRGSAPAPSKNVFYTYEKTFGKLKDLLPAAYDFSRKLSKYSYTFEYVGANIVIARSSPDSFRLTRSEWLKPYLLSLIPLSCTVHSPTKSFISELSFSNWLALMKTAMELGELNNTDLIMSLRGLSEMLHRRVDPFIDRIALQIIEEMITNVLERLTFDHLKAASHCNQFSDLVMCSCALFIRNTSAVTFAVESQDTRVISERLIERLPTYCQSAVSLIERGADGIVTLYEISHLLDVLFFMSKYLHHSTNQMVPWQWLKSVVENSDHLVSDEKTQTRRSRNIIRLGQLAAHWSIDDRSFWTAWLATYHSVVKDDIFDSIGDMRWASKAAAASVEALLKCSETNTLGLASVEQKRQVIKFLSKTVKFLDPAAVEYLKILVEANKRNIETNAGVFDECDSMELTKILSAYKPVKIVRLKWPEETE